MDTARIILQNVVTVSFVLLGGATLLRWVRTRDPTNGYLALAVGLLATVSLVGRVNRLLDEPSALLFWLNLAAFEASGYAFLLFRHSFVPVSATMLGIALAANVAALASALAVGLPLTPPPRYPPAQLGALLAVVGVWSACVGEPAVRFLTWARGRPGVQGVRLRMIGIGYLGVVVVLLATVGAGRGGTNPRVQLATQIAVVLLVPLVFAGVVAPRWLRRLWREREEEAFRLGLADLLVREENPGVVARRALGWAMRIVGGEAACVLGPDGTAIAAEGDNRAALGHLGSIAPWEGARLIRLEDRTYTAIVPLRLRAGVGTLVVVSGPFTPLFGPDELQGLRWFAEALAVAMERAELDEALAASRAALAEAYSELEKQKIELERSNEELERFASVASHDLQEPLRMVASYAQLIERRYRGRLDHDADEFINEIVDGARRMQQLIDDLLALSRVGTREIFELTDCNEVIEAAAAALRAPVEDTGARVTHGRLPVVFADRAQLLQLFQNLIGNAIKFRSAGPPEIHVSSDRSNGDWVLSVRDNGIGIDPTYAEQVFVMFQRLHGRAEYPGTGIGLAICRKIVERHGGRIWVEPTEDTGSVFRFTLPIADGRAPDVA